MNNGSDRSVFICIFTKCIENPVFYLRALVKRRVFSDRICQYVIKLIASVSFCKNMILKIGFDSLISGSYISIFYKM